MELQQLRYLNAVADAGSFSQAARDCFTSRQNITHAIKSLESEMGVAFFKRSGSKTVLTASGQQAVHRAYEILRLADDFESCFREAEHDGFVSFALSTNIFISIPHETEEYLANISDHVRVEELSCSSCYEGVCSGDLDVALVLCMEQYFPGCISYELASSDAFLLVSDDSDLAKKDALALDELLNQQLLVMSEPSFQYRNLEKAFAERGKSGGGVHVIPSSGAAFQMARHGKGCCIISQKLAENPPRDLTAIPVDADSIRWHFYFLCRQDPSSNPLIGKILHSVKATFKGQSMSPFKE